MTETNTNPSRPILSPALSSAIMGGLMVGPAAALFAFAFIGPQTNYGFGGMEIMLVGLLGSVFGTVAGAVAGASETGDERTESLTPVAAPRPAETAVPHGSAAQYT